MPRQDVPYGGAICRLKERIAEIWDRLDQKLHSINGVEGDGAGDVKIVSGDAAVVINNDQIGHRIEVGLDHGNLPSAAVSSVNGQTGAVRLDAVNILSDGDSNVQSDIDENKSAINDCFNSITSEQVARQNADAELQGNINSVQASIPGAAAAAVSSDPTVAQLVDADAQNVKLTKNQAISGIKTVPTASTGSRTQQIANGEKLQNDLDNYSPMVRTTVKQKICVMKTFYGISIEKNTPGLDFIDTGDASNTTKPPTLLQTLIPFRTNDGSLNFLMQFIHNSNGDKWVQITCIAENGATHVYMICGVDSNGNQINPKWVS